MTAVKTVIGALEEARDVLLQRVSGLTALQTQRAIEELVAQIAAVSASVANAAPKTAQYLVTATDATLTAERVATDTATITWDFATAGQAKANLAITPVVGSLGATDNAVLRADGTGGATAQGSLVTIGDTGILNGATAVGVNATADTTNRLSVNSAAVLFNHNGAGTQIKVNKNATGDTGSYLFQTGFSGRAEFGTIGDNDFTLKTSPDGSAFTTALIADNATGALRVGVNLRPSANDGAALGSATVGWADAFFASGGVLNWNNGTLTLTQSSGSLLLSGTSATFQVLGTGNSGVEIGRIDGSASTPFIDFHSGATAVDFDARIIASGGTGVAGAGVLTISATGGVTLGTATAFTCGTLELGAATDTTLARASAGDVNIEGNRIYRAGGTDVPVADGGTGASSLTAYAVLCGGTTSTNPVQSIASVGTSGHVLTSNGAAALPTFQAPVGGGLTLLTSGTVSAAATLDIVLTTFTAYRAIKFVLQDFVPTNDDAELWMRVSTNGGSSYDTTGYSHAGLGYDDSGSSQNTDSISSGQIVIAGNGSIATGGVSNVASEGGANVEITLFDQANTGIFPAIQAVSRSFIAVSRTMIQTVAGTREAAQDTDAVRFLFETAGGNIASGKYAVYGLS